MPMAEPNADYDRTPEPPRWSVVADDLDHIWLRIGNDHSGRGIWMRTSGETRYGDPVYSQWGQLRPTCVLADGLEQPRVTAPEGGSE